MKSGFNSLNIKRLYENWASGYWFHLDTGSWMLEKGVARTAQAKADQTVLVRLFGGRDKAFGMGTKAATPALRQGSE